MDLCGLLLIVAPHRRRFILPAGRNGVSEGVVLATALNLAVDMESSLDPAVTTRRGTLGRFPPHMMKCDSKAACCTYFPGEMAVLVNPESVLLRGI